MTLSTLVAFTAVAIVAVVAPGPDMALVTRNTVRGGRRVGVATAAGIGSGLAVHGVAAALGLSAVLAASARAFMVVKIVGALYLAYLGLQALRSAVFSRYDRGSSSASRGSASPAAGWRQGLVTNLTNPKAVVFFVGLLPQFVTDSSSAGQTLALAAILMGVAISWFSVYAVLLSVARAWFERPRVRRMLDALTGVAMVAFGAKLAATER